MVVDSAYLLDFVSKSSYFGMVEIVAVFVCNILVYMVQKRLVVNNHHRVISNPYDEVLVFFFYFVERMGNFHYDPVEDVN